MVPVIRHSWRFVIGHRHWHRQNPVPLSSLRNLGWPRFHSFAFQNLKRLALLVGYAPAVSAFLRRLPMGSFQLEVDGVVRDQAGLDRALQRSSLKLQQVWSLTCFFSVDFYTRAHNNIPTLLYSPWEKMFNSKSFKS